MVFFLEWDLPKLTRDADGFVQSFDPDQVDEYMNFFEQYGFVVVNNVLSGDQVNATVDEIWTELEKTAKNPIPR